MDPELLLGAAKCIRLDKIAPQTTHKGRKWDRTAPDWRHSETSTPKAAPQMHQGTKTRARMPQKYITLPWIAPKLAPGAESRAQLLAEVQQIGPKGRKWDKMGPKLIPGAAKCP